MDIRNKNEEFERKITEFSSLRQFCGVSCWSRANDESFASWKLYVPGGEGVAIQTTKGLLCASFEGDERKTLMQGEIRYGVTNSKFDSTVFFNKKAAYFYENEFRLFVDLHSVSNERTRGEKIKSLVESGGFYFKLKDLSFIKQIFLSPFCGKYLEKIVNDACDRVGLEVPITMSELSKS